MNNVAQELNAALPNFYAFSKNFRDYLSNPSEHFVYDIFGDYAEMLTILIDVRNEADLTLYYAFLNRMIDFSDDYIKNCIYECIIEPLALARKDYYEESLKRLNTSGVELLMFCKANPPLGEVPPPW